uniref:type I protein arginine methyltransferase n=1 Tax=Meloidogyne incognita TaxID=6306 RepID=A0A914MJ05_MELIC
MNSEFNSRTEEGSAKQYFQFYGSLFQQQNMMQDYTRTATYQRAIHENYLDFRDKVILDVGAGSGILSFFAAQVGAKRVYAVEASSMADSCKSLVSANGLNDVIKVITGKIEEIELPESVDVIISEPMGYMLVNERMLESYLFARKFLKEGGRMFPTQANLQIALFSDEQVYLEQTARSSFWTQESFHGINLSSLKSAALEEVFRQPIVDTWHIGILMSTCISWNFNFENDEAKRLQRIEIPFEFNALRTGYIHGLATWFDVGFMGQTKTVYLSTAPTEPLTHWYQVRLLIKNPLFVTIGQLVTGKLLMLANDKQSYDLDLEIEVGDKRQQNELDLKMPHFRYNGQPVSQPPPGNSTENPLEQLNQHLAIAVATAQQQQLNNNGNNNLNFSPAYSTCLYTNSLTNSGGKDYSATTTSADILVQNGTLN